MCAPKRTLVKRQDCSAKPATPSLQGECQGCRSRSVTIAVPQVILTDQTAGLIASMPDAMPYSNLQHCGWRIAQNIKKRLAAKKYLMKKHKAIMNLVWFYIQSSSKTELDENKTTLLKSLKDEQHYIQKY